MKNLKLIPRFDFSNKSFVNFQLLDKESNIIIGGCGFHIWYIEHSRAEIGYAITLEEHKQKGYMLEAVRRILQYGFEEMQLNRIEAFIGPTNMASIQLIQKFGFVYEGCMRQHYCKNNNIQDSGVYSLLKEEYTHI